MTHDRGSGPYENGQPVRAEHRWQAVTNEVWPQHDDKGPHARGREYADKPAHEHVAVEVRCEFERDGEVWLPGRATRWHGQHVFVVVNDARVRMGVWVLAGDVRRA